MTPREKREKEYRSELSKILADNDIIEKILCALSSGDRMELLITKDGLKILRVRKKEIKTTQRCDSIEK